jgi:hypothetical protein
MYPLGGKFHPWGPSLPLGPGVKLRLSLSVVRERSTVTIDPTYKAPNQGVNVIIKKNIFSPNFAFGLEILLFHVCEKLIMYVKLVFIKTAIMYLASPKLENIAENGEH